MNRRNFIKTVAATSVALTLPVVSSSATAKPAKPIANISAPKKKDGFFTTGNAALNGALGGGIPYLSYVLVTGEDRGEQAAFIDDIQRLNDPKDYYDGIQEPGHIARHGLACACVRHNCEPPVGHIGEYRRWSFRDQDSLDFFKEGMKRQGASEQRCLPCYGWTIFEIENNDEYKNPQDTRFTYADIVIHVSKDNYYVIKNGLYYYFYKNIQKIPKE